MTNTVTVGCKLPNGMIISVKGVGSVTLAGSNSSRIIGGYGLTAVPSDLWEAWSGPRSKSALIENKIVFAQTTHAKAEGQAKEQESVTTGLEPLAGGAGRDGAPITRK